MNINIYQIGKENKDEYFLISQKYEKMSKKYANVKIHNVFNSKIAKAQTLGAVEAKNSYTQAFLPKLNSYNISLDVKGIKIDTIGFSKLIQSQSKINFFIGGAYGFNDQFLKKCDKNISLSNLTYGHKIASIVLIEQVFRALCINNNHPYHK